MVLTERGVASRVRARRFGARHGNAVEASQGRARSGWAWFCMARQSRRGGRWRGTPGFGRARSVKVRRGKAVDARCGGSRRGHAWHGPVGRGGMWQGSQGQSRSGIVGLGLVRYGEAVVEWRVLVRLVLASFGEARLGRATQSRRGPSGSGAARFGVPRHVKVRQGSHGVKSLICVQGWCLFPVDATVRGAGSLAPRTTPFSEANRRLEWQIR